MKRILLLISILALGLMLCNNTPAQAYTLTNFKYGEYDYGEMYISQYSQNQLLVGFKLFSGLSGEAKVAGFGFSFDGAIDMASVEVSNPAEGTATNWYELAKLNQLPNPTNDGTVTKDDFNYGVTSDLGGTSINQKYGAIQEGETDYFILTFLEPVVLGAYDPKKLGEGFVNLAAVRIQGLPVAINGDSLFLVPVPEPATMLLLGSGLIGLGAFGRKKLRRSL